MLTRSTPMKRTGFKPRMALVKREPNRDAALAQRAQAAMKNVVPRAAVMCGSTSGPAPKEPAPLRSERYRRAVASLPCVCCGIVGISQCAHANTGKGAGTKVSDLDSFPLCASQPGRRGCHLLFDQGAMFSKDQRRQREAEWIARTQAQVISAGMWPRGLALPPILHPNGGEA